MHIYFFAPIRYDFLHQRPQKLADQFRMMSIQLTYVQPSGLNEYLSGKQQGLVYVLLESLWYHVIGLLALVLPFVNAKPLRAARRTRVHSDFEIMSLPVTFPTNRVNSPILEALTCSIYRRFLRRRIGREEKNNTVAIFENPFWGGVVEKGDFSWICYDCIDDLSIYAGHASLDRFLKYESELVTKADVIVATAARLEAHLRARAPSRPVLRIPNGVDYDWFQKQAENAPTPDDLQQLKRPIVGYVGYISAWTDYALIREVAGKMPDMSFVFVGPVDFPERLKELRATPNTYWLGQKLYADIPAYIKAFDVCIIPFKGGGIAHTTNPVKLFEYFALGKPVASTPLEELTPYVKDGLVFCGDSPESFAQAVIRGLEESDEHRKRLRMSTAQHYSWRAHAQKFIDAINTAGR